MPNQYDFHCHSTASDGSLTPTQLIQRAKQKGVKFLSVTDHDTVDSQHEAKNAASEQGIEYFSGIEISTTWEKKCFHIVGLNIDPENTVLKEGIKNLQILRVERAKKISQKLEKKRIDGAFESIVKSANESMITRSHFADFILSKGYVKTKQEAFDKYLGKGKPAFVSTCWADLELAIQWIDQAGGKAIIAHPLRYHLSASWMRRFLSTFKEMGGHGIEVVTGRSSEEDIRRSTSLAKQFSLSASIGSDFHSPDQWVELGQMPNLPTSLTPIYESF